MRDSSFGLNRVDRAAASGGVRAARATLPLAIADIQVELNVPASLEDAARERYRDFVQATHPSQFNAPLRLFAAESAIPDCDSVEGPPWIRLVKLSPTFVSLEGDCSGRLDLAEMHGEIRGPHILIALDALLRLALSLLVPRSGWLLLHGAAIAMRDGRWSAVVGQSGSGKSTAARAFDSYCDELVLVRPGNASCEAASTPYWHGRSAYAECGAIVCLDKGGDPEVRRLHGTDAVRAIATHVVRHLRLERSEEQSMARLCALARCVPVYAARCPTGNQFVPYLSRALARMGSAPLEPDRDQATADALYA